MDSLAKELADEQNVYDQQEEIIKYTPGGMHVCYLSDPIHLEYASEGLCRMLGYTTKEFDEKTKAFYLANVPKEDHQIFFDFILRLAKEYTKDTCEYRMIRKDGTIIYVSDTMESKMCPDGIVRGYSSVTDITELKKTQLELHQQKEEYKELYNEVLCSATRFRVISKFSGILFFEYRMDLQKYTAFENYEDVLLYNRRQLYEKIGELKYNRKTSDIFGDMALFLHPDDAGLPRIYGDKVLKDKEISVEVRFLCGDFNYHWFLVEAQIPENNPNIVMGCMRNIDSKRCEMDALKEKATKDPMTQLKNKVDGFEEIDTYLKENPKSKNALVFLDLDEFKSVNDTLGHDVGDQVLQYTSSIIRNIFREDDVMIRFGGDEFIVFMKNLRSKQVAAERVMRFRELCKQCPSLDGTDLKLSASIGIAFSDENSTAHSLTCEADESAYRVKRTDKGGVYAKDYLDIASDEN